MTSRPDLLAIDMKRQGRFGLCVPLFPAQGPEDVMELFETISRLKKITLSDEIIGYVRAQLGTRPLTGSDVEAILIRAKEKAVFASATTMFSWRTFRMRCTPLSTHSILICLHCRS